MDISEFLLKSKFSTPVVIVGLCIAFGSILGLKGYSIQKEKTKYYDARVLEGKVLSERHTKIPGGGCTGPTESYSLKVKLSDGSTQIFDYHGQVNVSKINGLYEPEDTIKFKQGFKPNYVPPKSINSKKNFIAQKSN